MSDRHWMQEQTRDDKCNLSQIRKGRLDAALLKLDTELGGHIGAAVERLIKDEDSFVLRTSLFLKDPILSFWYEFVRNLKIGIPFQDLRHEFEDISQDAREKLIKRSLMRMWTKYSSTETSGELIDILRVGKTFVEALQLHVKKNGGYGYAQAESLIFEIAISRVAQIAVFATRAEGLARLREFEKGSCPGAQDLTREILGDRCMRYIETNLKPLIARYGTNVLFDSLWIALRDIYEEHQEEERRRREVESAVPPLA